MTSGHSSAAILNGVGMPCCPSSRKVRIIGAAQAHITAAAASCVSSNCGCAGTFSIVSPKRPSKPAFRARSEEHTSELQSLLRISYAVFCLKKNTNKTNETIHYQETNKQ